MLKVENLHKKFGESIILDNISFNLDKGEILVVLGPSGSGKSTLLRCIKGLENVDQGQILFQGDQEHISMVFQDFNLWHHLTVKENLMLAPLIVQKRNKTDAYQEMISLLEKIGLQDKLHAYPHELSGGQKQRVALARALLTKPQLLLLDEITSALDPALVKSVEDVIRFLASIGMTMIIVTHDRAFAKEVGTKFLLIKNGAVEMIGSKEIMTEENLLYH